MRGFLRVPHLKQLIPFIKIQQIRESLADKLEKKVQGMLVANAAERNKKYILDVLQGYLPPADSKGQVLEIASGPGQHIAYFASNNSHVTFQPSDKDEEYLRSITAHKEHNALTNIQPPLTIDITKPVDTSISPVLTPKSWDLIININMVHISPWDTSLGLFQTAGNLLKPGGVLFMYGPFKIDGVLAPESNVRFDATLRSKDPSWGVREVRDLEKLANQNGLKFEKMVDMPANNHCTIFRKDESTDGISHL